MANIQDRKLDSAVSDVIEFVNQSRQYMSAHYWDELAETFRAIKCRTTPIMKTVDGKKVEDLSRTNVCMPDLNLIWRKNVARMTAQPYRLRYTGGKDPMIAEMLSALAIQQFDRSNEAVHDRRVVMMSEAFGWAHSKLYWDCIAPERKFRKALMRGSKIVYNDRRSIMRSQGAPDDEIEGAVQQYGEQLTPDEVSDFIGRSGNEIQVSEVVSKYEGPCVKSVFTGDLFWDPSALTLDDSPKVVEAIVVDELWLKKQVETLKYADENGQEVPAFDPKAVQDLIDLDPGTKAGDEKVAELRQMFRNVENKGVPRINKELLGIKRFDLLESHQIESDGRVWVTWISESMRDKPIGRMPYPWDLYGKYVYNELVTLPDMISAYGDSTPRLLRFLHLLLNQTHSQNFDYITNAMKPFMLIKNSEDLPDEAIQRAFYRELKVKDPNSFKELSMSPLPGGSFERGSELWRMLGMAEPILNNIEAGTEANPQAGKTATTAVLNAKSGDQLTQFKMLGRDIYCRELGMKKLWMNQQAADEAFEIQKEHWGQELKKSVDDGSFNKWAQESGEGYEDPVAQYALSDRNGKTVAIRLDPTEIQEDYQVECEAGSYLSVDDEFKSAAANDLVAMAQQDPSIFDIRKIARFKLSTIRGIGNPDDYILPEQPQSAMPPIKGNFNVSIPIDKMPSDVVNQLLPLLGLQPSAELEHRDTVAGVKQIGEAADAAAKLAEPAQQPEEPNIPALHGVGK